ncbi:hypothetical protein BKA70DRAFT_1448178 [Coprinopsis sp. MPI-PUGE-AT-0042]|nr:hypothetical protein BKA70DRAFT_1448178 [Coprinopsis sp. MPI-PUGE-AT-0042]
MAYPSSSAFDPTSPSATRYAFGQSLSAGMISQVGPDLVAARQEQPPPGYANEPAPFEPVQVAEAPANQARQPPCPGFWHCEDGLTRQEGDLCNDCDIRAAIDIADEAVLRLTDQFQMLSDNFHALSTNLREQTLPSLEGRIAVLERDRVTTNDIDIALDRFTDYVRDLVLDNAEDIQSRLIAEQERIETDVLFNRAQIAALVHDAELNNEIFTMIEGAMRSMVRRVTTYETWICNLNFVRLAIAFQWFSEGVAHHILHPSLRMILRIQAAVSTTTIFPAIRLIALILIGFAIPFAIDHIDPIALSSMYSLSVTTLAMVLVIDRIRLFALSNSAM